MLPSILKRGNRKLLNVQNPGNRSIRALPPTSRVRKLTRAVDTKETTIGMSQHEDHRLPISHEGLSFLQQKLGFDNG